MLVVAGLLLLTTACQETPVVPSHTVYEESSPAPELIIPLNDSVYVKGKGKPVRMKPEPPVAVPHADVMPLEMVQEK